MMHRGRTAPQAPGTHRLCWLLSWLILLWPGLAGAAETHNLSSLVEDYLEDSWTKESGLPQSTVTSVIQSRDGYLWIGTLNGLARFDGLRFTVFNTLNTPDLVDNRIIQLHTDAQGRLWIVTQDGGLCQYQSGRFSTLVKPARGVRNPVGVVMDDQGGAWFACQDGTLHHILEGQTRQVAGSTHFNFETIQSFTSDREGNLWLQTGNNRLYRLRRGVLPLPAPSAAWPDFACQWVVRDSRQNAWMASKSEIAQWKDGELHRRASEPNIQTMFPALEGGVYVLANGRLRRCDEKGWQEILGEDELLRTPPGDPRSYICFQGRPGHVWMGVVGLGLFHLDGRPAAGFKSMGSGRTRDRFRCLLEDQEGSLWIGLETAGLWRLHQRRVQLIDAEPGLSESFVVTVDMAANGEFWSGSVGRGIYHHRNFDPPEHFGPAQGLLNPDVSTILVDHLNQVWAGTRGGGIFRLQDGLFSRKPLRDFSSPQADDRVSAGGLDFITASYEDSSGNVWFGTQGGLVCMRTNSPTIYTVNKGLPHNDICCVTEDSTGAMWIGTAGGGLARLSNQVVTAFSSRDGFPYKFVWALYADRQNRLWIGSADGGLSCYENRRFVHFNRPNAAIPLPICCILEDNFTNLWLTSYEGILRIPKASLVTQMEHPEAPLEILNLGISDGLPSIECPGGYQPAGIKTADGQLCLPTVKGRVRVNPANLRLNLVPPPVQIEEFSVADQAQDLRGSGGNQTGQPELSFSSGKRNYVFSYTALSFADPGKVRFKYRLRGYDPDWVDASGRRTAYYSQLPPANYVFEVKACNNHGVWNEAGARLAFGVSPQFWQRRWFQALSAAVLLGGTAGIARIISIRRLQRRLQQLEQARLLEAERARIAQDLHDDLGARLTKISMLTEQAQRTAQEQLPASDCLSRLDVAAREIIEALDETVWAVNPQNDTLEQLANYLFNYVESFLADSPIRHRVHIPADLPEVRLSAELRHNLYLTVKEALNNLAKYARASEVRIELKFDGGTLGVSIDDNGQGFDISHAKTKGNGLLNMQNRIEKSGGQFSLQSSPGQGTHIQFSIPIPMDPSAVPAH